MIIIKISSGLGNQLFQYAFALSLSKRRNVQVKIDTSTFILDSKITKRQYLLDKFNISLDIATKSDFKSIKVPYPADKSFMENIFRIIFRIQELFRRNKKIGVYRTLLYDEKMFDIKDNTYIAGVWTNEKYFKDIRSLLLKEFSIKNLSHGSQKLIADIRSKNSVSVHIRRGDYLKYTHKFVNLDENYYKQAVKIIKEKVSNPFFYIFSDDIEFVKNNYDSILGPDRMYISNPKTIPDEEEFWLMSNCMHNVIANSTYSWWAAWLNQNKEKIILAPKKYRKDNKMNDGFLPDEWISI